MKRQSAVISGWMKGILSLLLVLGASVVYGQHEGALHDVHPEAMHVEEEGHGKEEHHGDFDLAAVAVHHIANQNHYVIGPIGIPLPCILYAPEDGWTVCMSSVFGPDVAHHFDGHYAYRRYVMYGGTVYRVVGEDFPDDKVEVEGFVVRADTVEGSSKEQLYVQYKGALYPLVPKSTFDAGLLGGGITGFYDFSISKNVVGMFVVAALLFWLFRRMARSYESEEGMAPRGINMLLEPIYEFIEKDVVKPFLGPKWEKYNPFLQSVFFFILGLNLFGQIPFFGSLNITGNLSVTLALALFTFFIVNLSGNRHYWQHVFWMPGVPSWVKVILTPVEFLSLFIKPTTLMFRLFANILAGHLVLVIFVGLIFVFGKAGENTIASLASAVPSILFSMFMMALELLVAFIQAFVFTILSASYLGSAVEEAHH